MKKLSQQFLELSQHTAAFEKRTETTGVENRTEFEARVSEARGRVKSFQDAFTTRLDEGQESLAAQWRKLDEVFTAQITRFQRIRDDRKYAMLTWPLDWRHVQMGSGMDEMRERVQLRSSARTSVGQVRANNEDSIHLYARDQFALAIVADGVGGAAGGEEASRIAVDTIHAQLIGSDDDNFMSYRWMEEDTLVEIIVDAIHTANINIVEAAAHDSALKGMGTTVTLALVRGTDVVIAHVGDSRAYFIEGEERRIKLITTDHTITEALVAARQITRKQAEHHPMKNVLYRALGETEDLEIDIHCDRLRIGDGLVLCSDGLTRHVKAPEIMNIVLGQRDQEASCQRLIDLANQRGGEDNISVVIMTA